ncbi:MAG: hypothetical protein R3D57_19515 [Hyphomicrobiaceae bacterium]
MLRHAACLLLALAVVASPTLAPAATGDGSTVGTPDQLVRWINGYRQKPKPKLLPAVVKAMQDLGLIGDHEQAGIYIGFVAGVLGDNQLTAEKLIEQMFPLGPDGQVVVIKAIAYSGLPEWRDLLAIAAEQAPERRVLIDRFLDGEQKLLFELPLEEAMTLDILWGYYIATGSYQPVQRIVDALQWANDDEELEKLTIGSMSKWTLASNAARDNDLLKLLYAERDARPEEVQAPLGEVIEAAETFEFGKLRKEALAAIEELKVKGPASRRTYSYAAMAGQTALALGCVAATALGQLEVGGACVVTGAVSSAALKLMGLQ